MKNLSRLICLTALAVAAAGCGGKKNSDAVVPENTVVAAYIDIEKAYDDGKNLVKEFIQALPSGMHDIAKKEYEKAVKKIDEIKDPLNPEWAVIAFGGNIKTLSKNPKKCVAVAVRINADEDAVTKVLKKHAADKDAVTIERNNGNVIFIDTKDDDRIGLVDGKYLIGASSKEAFEEMFDLYAGKGKVSEEFDDLSRISENTICRIQTAPVSSLLDRFELTKYVEKFGEDSQDEELSNMIRNMGPISLDIALADGGELVLRVECDSSDDAEIVESAFQLPAFAGRALSDGIRYVAKNKDLMGSTQSLMDGVDNLLQNDLFKALLRTPSKASRSGKTAELRSGLVSNPFIVVGVFFPVMTSAMLSANGNSMSMQGRKLVVGIVQANIDRQGKADPVWPRTEVAEDADKMDDVTGRAYDTSTEYFNALFNMQRYGSTEWEPCVDGELLSTLWGCGVPGMTGRRLESRNIAWTIAANVADETPDFIPVLITANFNPSLLLRKWDGRTNRSEILPIGPESGAAATPFGNKAVVIVRKSGAAETIKAKDLTYDKLYKGLPFDLTNMNPPLKYLTPTGIVNPVGR